LMQGTFEYAPSSTLTLNDPPPPPLADRHSHTEIADRLFSMLKKIFDTDSGTRVTGVGGFAGLAKGMEKVFEKCDETLKRE
jgi:hypothetical protein